MKIGLLLLLSLFAALPGSEARGEEPLFSTHSVMDITIPLDFKTLCRPRESQECGFTPTVLEYGGDESDSGTLPVEVIIRGGWRSLTKNCSAPLLFVKFSEEDTAGTPFEGQSLLPLTTHCGQGLSLEAAANRPPRSAWEQYLLKEYLAHRLYNIVTETSLRARLVRIRYPNPENPGRSIRNYAFFTEHFDSLAQRARRTRLPRGNFEPGQLDAASAADLALFQYMIGNTDWSIVRERNIILLSGGDDVQIPVPYDFDMSGLVDAHYAGPAPSLPIDSVRERYFLGYCHPENDWDTLFGNWLSRQSQMLDLVDQIPGLDRDSKRSTNRFLGDFFTTLQNPQERNAHIVQHCLDWPPDPEDHMSPFTK